MPNRPFSAWLQFPSVRRTAGVPTPGNDNWPEGRPPRPSAPRLAWYFIAGLAVSAASFIRTGTGRKTKFRP